jgi:hypothetical protein
MTDKVAVNLAGLRFPDAIEIWKKNYEFLIETDPQVAWNYACQCYGTAYFRGAVEQYVGDKGTAVYSAFCTPSLARLIGWEVGDAAFSRCAVNDAARTMIYVDSRVRVGPKAGKAQTVRLALPF